MKRDLSILLIVMMIFSLGTINVKANDGDVVDDETSLVEEKNNDGQESEEDVFYDDSSLETEDAYIVDDEVIEETNENEISLASLDESIEEKVYVAQLGDTKYESIQEAIASAIDGDTISIINDIVFDATDDYKTGTLNNYPVYTFVRIQNKNNLIIDFQNHKVSINCNFAAYSYFFNIENSTVVFTGEGTLDGNNPVGNSFNNPKLINVVGGELTIKNGTYISGTPVQVESGTLNIEDGFYDIDPTMKAILNSMNDAYRASYTDAWYKFLINCIDDNYANGTAHINITGGSFVNFNPENNNAEGSNTNFLASNGWYEVSESDGVYTVNKKKAVALVDGVEYKTLKEAFEVEKENIEITLINDVNIGKEDYIVMDDNKNIILNLNNHNIKASGGKSGVAIFEIQNGSFTINGDDSSVVDSENYQYGVHVKGDGTLYLNGGHFKGSAGGTIFKSGKEGTIYITGGTYECPSYNGKSYVINQYDNDAYNSAFIITGGLIKNSDPSDCKLENPSMNYVPDGYKVDSSTDENGDIWYAVSVDKSTLKEALDTYDNIINSLDSGYCKDSVEAYTKAYISAKEVYENNNATVIDVTNAITLLNDAYSKLTKHEIIKVDAKAETCTEDGYMSYYKCDKCGAMFSDENGINQINEPEIIKAHGHLYQKVNAKEPTIGSTGNIEYYRCGYCDKLFIKDKDNYKEISDVILPKVDTTKLDKLISEAKSDLSKYTKTSGDAYIVALENARTIRNNNASKQIDVTNVLTNLTNALNALEEKTKASVPIFSLKEGTYTSGQTVTIKQDEGGSKVVAAINEVELPQKSIDTTFDLTGQIGKKIEYTITAYTLGDDDHLSSDVVTFKYVIDIKDEGKLDYTEPITSDKTRSLDPSLKIDANTTKINEEVDKEREQGKDVILTLSVEDAVNENEIKEINKQLNENTSLKTISTVDITLSLSVKGETLSKEIKNTEDEISISVKIAPEHINNDDSINRTYKVIRTHTNDDETIDTRILNTTFDKETKTVTFKTDRFSTYALVYIDTLKNTKKEDNPISHIDTKPNNEVVKTCEEAIGRNWVWSIDSNTCVYKVTNTSSK